MRLRGYMGYVDQKSHATSDYLSTVYSEKKPRTAYPGKLAKYLCERFSLTSGMRFLEVGCGRCEFLYGFATEGLAVTGVDISPYAQHSAPDLDIILSNVAEEPLPFADNTFDIVYSKSFIEHLEYPEVYFKEAFRILKKGGICLTLVPDWESCYKTYFADHTHKTPFTRIALQTIYEMVGFENIAVTRFRQLPILWKYPMLEGISQLVAPFVPVRTKNTFLRWSRELMVIGVGSK